MLKKIPLPITGVMLGFAALGNLLQSYSQGIRLVCGAISAVLGILFLLKVALYPRTLAEDLKNPIMASVFPTFDMALMLLSTYLAPFVGDGMVVLWYLGILIHLAMIVYFTAKFLLKLQLNQVFASYFVMYAGTGVIGVTAPVFGRQDLGRIAFWFAFLCLLALLVLVSYRYLKLPQVPEPAKPLFCIYTAPMSLCLAAYNQSMEHKSVVFLCCMAVAAQALYLMVLTRLPSLLRLKFYPSYASFTFPFIISAIALKLTMGSLAALGYPQPWMSWLVLAETVIAVVLALYTLLRFLQYLFQKA